MPIGAGRVVRIHRLVAYSPLRVVNEVVASGNRGRPGSGQRSSYFTAIAQFSAHEVIIVQVVIQESDRFEFNRSEVAVKVIDGEAVAIDVLTGKYHGATGAACGILQQVGHGVSPGEIADVLESRFPDAKDRIRGDLCKFAGQLLEQRIVVRAAGGAAMLGASPSFDDATYVPPELDTYDDMAELLALDPPMPTVLDSPWHEELWSARETDVGGFSREEH